MRGTCRSRPNPQATDVGSAVSARVLCACVDPLHSVTCSIFRTQSSIGFKEDMGITDAPSLTTDAGQCERLNVSSPAIASHERLNYDNVTG
jgi:hypothetical protein